MALIDSIHSVSEFLLRLLDDSLELAHAESGTAQLRTAPSTVADDRCAVRSDEPPAGRQKTNASQFHPRG